MSEIEIITDGGRRRHWSAAEKLRIVEETLDDESISSVARRNGVAPDLLYHWRRLMLEGGTVAVTSARGLSKAIKLLIQTARPNSPPSAGLTPDEASVP